jgi:hypothetical protein
VIKNLNIFGSVVDTDMKQHETSKETHKRQLKVLDICSINYSGNVNTKNSNYSMHVATVTNRRLLRHVKLSLEVLEATVALEIGIPNLSSISSCI